MATFGSIQPTQSSGLIGIARMAQSSPKVRDRAEAEFFALAVRSTLNRESSGRMPFAWTINPYRGCEFGCQYCYARYTHEFMEHWDGLDFERKIYAKANAPELLRAELAAARDKGLAIALGTATDPYQPAEKQFKVPEQVREQQIGKLKAVKARRDADLVAATLGALKAAAGDEKTNLMPLILDAVHAYASIGEICGVLRGVFGEYQESYQM